MAWMDPLKVLRARVTTMPDADLFTVRFYRLVRAGRLLPFISFPGVQPATPYQPALFWSALGVIGVQYQAKAHARQLSTPQLTELQNLWHGIITVHLQQGGEVYLVLDDAQAQVKDLLFIDQRVMNQATVQGRSCAWDGTHFT